MSKIVVTIWRWARTTVRNSKALIWCLAGLGLAVCMIGSHHGAMPCVGIHLRSVGNADREQTCIWAGSCGDSPWCTRMRISPAGAQPGRTLLCVTASAVPAIPAKTDHST